MEINKYLDDNILIVTSTSNKEKILLNLNKMYNLKFMTIQELIKNLTFSYDEQAIYYLMKKYNYKYDIATMYLENLYYIGNVEDKNIDKLKEIKQELEEQKLLRRHKYFKEYLRHTKVIIYDYYLNKFENKMIDEIKKITEVKILNEKQTEKEYTVYEFKNIEDEITFVATKIIELINKEIPSSLIKIANIDDEYLTPIERIFSYFNLEVDSNNNKIYSNIKTKKFLKSLKETKNIIFSLEQIKLNKDIYNNILNICNKYMFKEEIDDYIIECIEEEIKKVNIKDNKQNIKIINLDDNIKNDWYVFLLNFNQNNIPSIHKDEKYLSDKVMTKLKLDTSNTLNLLEQKKVMQNINKINNLTITYKLATLTQKYYKSSLVDMYNMNVEKVENIERFNYSNLYNRLELSKALDKLIKYNEKSLYLSVLMNSVDNLDYLSYNNQFTGIDQNDFFNYIDHKLLLSYSSVDNYYRCGFRYYINNILKLSKYEETFSIFIGNLFHYILSKAFLPNFDFEKEFYIYFKDKKMSSKEIFFIEKLKQELLFIIDTIKKQNKISHFEKELYEEKIYINKEKNIKITFMGIIDKIKYKEINGINYVAIIDYKTGYPQTNLKNTIYGIEMQLPIYLYLAKNTNKLKNVEVIGLYLQKIINKKQIRDLNKDYKETRENNLKLDGYSIAEEEILENFDITYKDSKLVKGLKTTSSGFYAYSKIITKEQIELLSILVEKKLKEAEDEILKANFKINPKRIGDNLKGCEYCKYKDLCYLKEEDIINLEEYKDLSFLKNN